MLTVRQHQLLTHFAEPVRADYYTREGTLRWLFCDDGAATPAQVHAEVNALLEDAAAEAERPVEVYRLRRLRELRRAARSGRAPA